MKQEKIDEALQAVKHIVDTEEGTTTEKYELFGVEDEDEDVLHVFYRKHYFRVVEDCTQIKRPGSMTDIEWKDLQD